MARKLARTVTVRDPESRRYVSVLAGTTPPPLIAELITNEAAWASDEPETAAGPPAPETSSEPSGEPSGAASGAVEQPAGNASKEEWAAYAIAQGADPVEIDTLTRNDIRDLYQGD